MTVQSDLLPPSVRNRRFVTTALKGWATIWVVVALIVFYVSISQSQHRQHLELTAAQTEAQAAPFRKLRSEERQMRQQISKIRERESWLTESDSGQTLQLLGIISRAAAENNGRVNVQTMDLGSIERVRDSDKASEAGRPGSARKKPVVEQKMQLDLNGLAVDDLAVASFVALLRETGVFESVELKSTLSEIVDGHETRKYEVSCVY